MLAVKGYTTLTYIGFRAEAILVEAITRAKASTEIARIRPLHLVRAENQDRSSQHEPVIYNRWPSFRHTNVCSLIDFFFDQVRMYEIIPYAKYGSLEECRMNPQFVHREDTLREFMKQILQACVYLRNLRLSHGDLKLANILLFEDGVKLTDFGCTVWHSNKREAKYMLGTQLTPEILAMSKFYNTELADVSMVRLCGKCVGNLDLKFDPRHFVEQRPPSPD